MGITLLGRFQNLRFILEMEKEEKLILEKSPRFDTLKIQFTKW